MRLSLGAAIAVVVLLFGPISATAEDAPNKDYSEKIFGPEAERAQLRENAARAALFKKIVNSIWSGTVAEVVDLQNCVIKVDQEVDATDTIYLNNASPSKARFSWATERGLTTIMMKLPGRGVVTERHFLNGKIKKMSEAVAEINTLQHGQNSIAEEIRMWKVALSNLYGEFCSGTSR